MIHAIISSIDRRMFLYGKLFRIIKCDNAYPLGSVCKVKCYLKKTLRFCWSAMIKINRAWPFIDLFDHPNGFPYFLLYIWKGNICLQYWWQELSAYMTDWLLYSKPTVRSLFLRNGFWQISSQQDVIASLGWLHAAKLHNSVLGSFRAICRKRFRKISERTVDITQELLDLDRFITLMHSF